MSSVYCCCVKAGCGTIKLTKLCIRKKQPSLEAEVGHLPFFSRNEYFSRSFFKLYFYSLLEYIFEPVIYFLLRYICHVYPVLSVEGVHTRGHLYCRRWYQLPAWKNKHHPPHFWPPNVITDEPHQHHNHSHILYLSQKSGFITKCLVPADKHWDLRPQKTLI